MANVTSKLCSDSQPVVCLPDKMQLFKNHPNTHGCLIGLRNKPGYKQTDELLVVAHTWIVSLCIQSLNMDKKHVFVCVAMRAV